LFYALKVNMRTMTLSLLAAVTVACSAANNSELDDDDAGPSNGSGANGGGFSFGGNGAGAGGPGDDCTEAAKLIYVLTDTGLLYSFKPDDKLFTLVGPMSCPTSMQPNSMAVDRTATAWVNYVEPGIVSDNAGVLFKVSTADASCDPAPAVTLPNGYYRIGMGFSTDGADTDDETLFVAGISGGGGLAFIDQNSLLQPIGNFGGAFAGQNAELTGTGDGRLFGFFTSIPVEVAELNKADAATLSNVPLATVEIPNAWAFSFWGGDFYLYTASLGNSRVNRYRPSDGSVDTSYMPDVGFRIVGAGVSTCAPLAPPN